MDESGALLNDCICRTGNSWPQVCTFLSNRSRNCRSCHQKLCHQKLKISIYICPGRNAIHTTQACKSNTISRILIPSKQKRGLNSWCKFSLGSKWWEVHQKEVKYSCLTFVSRVTKAKENRNQRSRYCKVRIVHLDLCKPGLGNS